MTLNLNDPKSVSEAGAAIYDRLYKAEYEAKHFDQYVAINLHDESATLGSTASQALVEAKKRHPDGFFYLIRVGHAGAFEVGLGYRNVSSTRVHR